MLNRCTMMHNSNFIQPGQFSRSRYGAYVIGLGTILEYRRAISTDRDEHILHRVSISTYTLKLLLLIVVINPGCRHDLWYILIIFRFNRHLPPRAVAQAKAKPKPAIIDGFGPADFESPSRQKPGQSRGFQAKPGRHITRTPPLWLKFRGK